MFEKFASFKFFYFSYLFFLEKKNCLFFSFSISPSEGGGGTHSKLIFMQSIFFGIKFRKIFADLRLLCFATF